MAKRRVGLFELVEVNNAREIGLRAASGEDLEARSQGYTALQWACAHARKEALAALLEGGADPKAVGPGGTTGLILALGTRNYGVFEKMLPLSEVAAVGSIPLGWVSELPARAAFGWAMKFWADDANGLSRLDAMAMELLPWDRPEEIHVAPPGERSPLELARAHGHMAQGLEAMLAIELRRSLTREVGRAAPARAKAL